MCLAIFIVFMVLVIAMLCSPDTWKAAKHNLEVKGQSIKPHSDRS